MKTFCNSNYHIQLPVQIHYFMYFLYCNFTCNNTNCNLQLNLACKHPNGLYKWNTPRLEAWKEVRIDFVLYLHSYATTWSCDLLSNPNGSRKQRGINLRRIVTMAVMSVHSLKSHNFFLQENLQIKDKIVTKNNNFYCIYNFYQSITLDDFFF